MNRWLRVVLLILLTLVAAGLCVFGVADWAAAFHPEWEKPVRLPWPGAPLLAAWGFVLFTVGVGFALATIEEE